ncbi:MAG: hypothetical protein IJ795_02015 [Bacteroidales bacterium]|nr:hypothetical protein [Bacteroidales bacterium]
MKKLILFVTFVLAFAAGMDAQDIITKYDGSEIKSKVLEISETTVKYKKWENLSGPTYTIKVSDIVMIRYENGTNEVFAGKSESSGNVTTDSGNNSADDFFFSNDNTSVNNVNLGTSEYFALDPSLLREGLKYKDIKDNYNKKDYKKLRNPAFGTGRAALNLLAPGIAQFTMNEPGLGLRYLLLGEGGFLLWGVGTVLGVNFGGGAFAVMMLTGLTMGITFEVLSITNAVKMAKVKSLYADDMTHWNQSGPSYFDFDFSLVPTLNVAPTPSGMHIAPGLGLRLTF